MIDAPSLAGSPDADVLSILQLVKRQVHSFGVRPQQVRETGRIPFRSINHIRYVGPRSGAASAWCFAPPTLRLSPRRKSWREAAMLGYVRTCVVGHCPFL